MLMRIINSLTRTLGSLKYRILRKKAKGDLTLEEWSVIDPIAPAQYQFLIEKKIPTLTIVVKNSWSEDIDDFRVQARLQDISDWVSKTHGRIAAGSKETIPITIPLSPEKLYGHEEKILSFDIGCKYTDPYGKEHEIPDSKPVRILAKDDMIWSIEKDGEIEDLSHFIAAWVMPRDPKVQELVHKVAEEAEIKSIGGLVGYQEVDKRTVLDRTQKIAPRTLGYFMVHLRQGATITGSLINVSGGANNDINFYIMDSYNFIQFKDQTYPKAYTHLKENRVKSGHHFQFVSKEENDYYLIFDNRFSAVSMKSVKWYVQISTPLTYEEIVRLQVGAIYRAIQRSGMNYVNTHISFAPGNSQRVKRPSDTIRLKGGNCIDGSVLFASCFEAIGFEPIVALVPGHAFVGVRTWADSDRYFFIETTMVNSFNFDDALSKAREEFERYSNEIRMIDIKKARKLGIKPLF